jgi:hypothetical protein
MEGTTDVDVSEINWNEVKFRIQTTNKVTGLSCGPLLLILVMSIVNAHYNELLLVTECGRRYQCYSGHVSCQAWSDGQTLPMPVTVGIACNRLYYESVTNVA